MKFIDILHITKDHIFLGDKTRWNRRIAIHYLHVILHSRTHRREYVKHRINTENGGFNSAPRDVSGLKPTFEVFIRLKTRLEEVFFQKC